MHMHLWYCVFYCSSDIDVIVAVEIGVNTTLQSNFGCAQVPCLACAIGDVVEREQVRGASQVEREGTFGEPAELALKRAYVCVIDIAVVHPRDGVAHNLFAQVVSNFCNSAHFFAASTKECDDLGFVDALSESDSLKDLGNWAAQLVNINFVERCAIVLCADQRGWRIVCTRIPLC